MTMLTAAGGGAAGFSSSGNALGRPQEPASAVRRDFRDAALYGLFDEKF
ncbi:hypothetical protein HH212_04310 [Massilia forsythiae]|uniref:Uncharacterized protein n=1 Tax=Massilia forsythiae TaxID=2728020 RepID=A0A7Z2ZRD5_9BURK|nr:hypothetical protein [Massilia forsythiae]QJD99352.1 hypothetical protein HH212_04310 [Massilia forsythiae]